MHVKLAKLHTVRVAPQNRSPSLVLNVSMSKNLHPGTKVLMAGVVPVKDLYHMACVATESTAKKSASSHVCPVRLGRRHQFVPFFTGTKANLPTSVQYY